MRVFILSFIFLFPSLVSADYNDEFLQAAKDNELDTISKLLYAGVDVNVINSDGKSALHFASEYENTDVMYKLINAGADLNIRNNNGATPMYLAANNGKVYAVHILMSKGAETSIKNKAGNTPYDIADMQGFSGITDLLMKNKESTSLAVLVELHNKKIAQADFNKYAQQALSMRGWKITKLDGDIFQGDLTKSSKLFRVRISLHDEYVMVRYMPAFGVKRGNYLYNLAKDFREVSGI